MFNFDLTAILGIARRDIIKYFRNRNQIISSLLMPSIFMIFMRQGFASVAQNPFLDFSKYIGAGIFCMTSVMGGLFMSALPILFDKMMGFMDVLTVSPTDHKNITLGFVLAGTFKILFQGTVILIIAIFTGLFPVDLGLGIFGSIISIFPIYLILILGGMSYACIGICVAARCDMQNAFLWTSILQIPLVFISGALFPTTGFPPVVAEIASLNPSTFLADGIRTFLGGEIGFSGTATFIGGKFGYLFGVNHLLGYLVDVGAISLFLIIMLNIAFKIYGRSLKESSGGFTGMVSKRMEKERKKMLKGLDPDSREAMNLLWNKFGAGDMPKVFMKMADGKIDEVEKMFAERGITKEQTNKIFEAGMKMMQKMGSGGKKK